MSTGNIKLWWSVKKQPDSFNIYHSLSPFSPTNLPAPVATGLAATTREFKHLDQEHQYDHYYRIASVKNGRLYVSRGVLVRKKRVGCIPTSLSFVPNPIFANKKVALRAYFNDVLVIHTLYGTSEEKTFFSREEKHESWLSYRLLSDLIVFYVSQAKNQFEVLPFVGEIYWDGDLNIISYENDQVISTPMPANQEITIKGYGYEEAINRFGGSMYIERRPAVLKLVKIPQNELPPDTVCFVTEQFGQDMEIDTCAFVQSRMN